MILERSPEIVAIDPRKSFRADLFAAIDVSPMVNLDDWRDSVDFGYQELRFTSRGGDVLAT